MRTAPIKYKQFQSMDEEFTCCGREKGEGRKDEGKRKEIFMGGWRKTPVEHVS